MKKNQALSLYILCLLISLVFIPAKSFSAPMCAEIFANTLSLQPQQGRDIGPIEFLHSLKLKIKNSDRVKNFNLEKYNLEVQRIESTNTPLENIKPDSLESFVAMLDVQMKELNISINHMDPIFRHKTYKLIDKILNKQGFATDSAAQQLAKVIFRGHFQKPTSFAFLLTHKPSDSIHEMFVQHLQTLVVTKTVTDTIHMTEQSYAPSGPGFFSRMTPKFIKEHKEVLGAGTWFGLTVAQSVATQNYFMILTPFNALKMKSSENLIKTSLKDNDVADVIVGLKDRTQIYNISNYSYAVIEKSLNWFAIGYIFAPFFIGG